MSGKTDEEEKEECEEEEEECEEEEEKKGEEEENDWDVWTDPLEELSEIEDAFEDDKKDKPDKKVELRGKTILDVGTDCVKPLYLALKYEPKKIVGINENFGSYFAGDIQQKSHPFTETTIRFDRCSLFNDEGLKKTLGNERFDYVLVSKTLHHLRGGECIASKRGLKHKCREDEKCCIYEFEEKDVFDRLLRLGNRVIIFEAFYPQDKDVDKERGRGGHFTRNELKRILCHLSKNYNVEFFRPIRCHLGKKELKNMIAKLRQVDCVCFYVERKKRARKK